MTEVVSDKVGDYTDVDDIRISSKLLVCWHQCGGYIDVRVYVMVLLFYINLKETNDIEYINTNSNNICMSTKKAGRVLGVTKTYN